MTINNEWLKIYQAKVVNERAKQLPKLSSDMQHQMKEFEKSVKEFNMFQEKRLDDEICKGCGKPITRDMERVSDNDNPIDTRDNCLGCCKPVNHSSGVEINGAKLDSGKNRLGLVLGGFSRALHEVGRVGTFGANKYSDNGWMEVPNGINRYTDAMLRHHMAEQTGEKLDSETGLSHAAATAWNALARLDLMIREEEDNEFI